jgi:hypothetical protein
MKILEYKVISKTIPIKDIHKLDEFERIVKQYINDGYVPVGNVSVVQQITSYILLQNMVKYSS